MRTKKMSLQGQGFRIMVQTHTHTHLFGFKSVNLDECVWICGLPSNIRV